MPAPSPRNALPRFASRSAICLAGLALLFVLGPRVEIAEPEWSSELPPDLDLHLTEAEARYPDLVPNTEKTIVWAHPSKQRTPLSLVYLHGFSASRQETAPLCDELAAELGANLFYTRLTGHGRHGDALGKATASDWLEDAAEALAIGQRLGEQVVLIGTSFGGSLALWLAQQPAASNVKALVLISPTLALRDPNARFLAWPWARQLIPLLFGAERHWTPANPEHELYWTERYPTTALVEMMGLINHARQADPQTLSLPLLILYSPEDRVVDPAEIEKTYPLFGSKTRKLVPINPIGGSSAHVLAGDILAPQCTAQVRSEILGFINSLPPRPDAAPAPARQ